MNTTNIIKLAQNVELAETALATAKSELLAAVNGQAAPKAPKTRKKAASAAPVAAAPKAAKAKGGKAKSKRGTIDREAVVKMLKEGKTAKAVAEALGCSLPSVNLIKKKAGLTKARA